MPPVFHPLSGFRRWWLTVLWMLCALVVCFGQDRQAVGLRVVVKDQDGRRIPGAVCKVLATTNTDQSIATATSDEEGVANFPNLIPGIYALRIERENFQPSVKSDVSVSDKVNEIVVTLSAATVAESVTITAPSEVSTTTAAGSAPAAGNLRRENLRLLPLAEARIDEALPLIPGVVRSSKGELAINGAGEQQN